jgi:hypothetical protein
MRLLVGRALSFPATEAISLCNSHVYHLAPSYNNIIPPFPRSSPMKGDSLVSNLQLLPQVVGLPHNLTSDHKAYWNKFIGESFKAHIGPRGKKSANGRTWTREMFIGGFCDELYPQLSPESRNQYELILGPVC